MLRALSCSQPVKVRVLLTDCMHPLITKKLRLMVDKQALLLVLYTSLTTFFAKKNQETLKK